MIWFVTYLLLLFYNLFTYLLNHRGHYTCPAFQGLNSDTMFIGSSYENEKEFIDSVGDKVQVIHLIGPEPHPLWPYTNFDSGIIFYLFIYLFYTRFSLLILSFTNSGSMKMNLWSTITQPQSYDERLKESASRVLPLLHDDAILLIDYLDGVGGEYNNPVWCSYANGARSAVLIAQDGIIIATQDWFSKDDLITIVNENL